MRRVFVDAAHYIAVLSPRESLHRASVRLATSLRDVEFVTTDSVLVEVLAYFANAGAYARREAVLLVQDVRGAPNIVALAQTRELFDAGLDLYLNRLDKGYSLTDCMSMVVCAEYDITEVLTYDHHFEQEGLVALLR